MPRRDMAPSPPLLILQDIAQNFGTVALLRGASLSVSAGERLALVGRNGSGKSSLLRIAAGLAQADGGTRFVQPGATVRYLPQEPDLSGFPTTLAYVEAGMGPGDETYRASWLLGELGLNGDEDPAVLSGGEARRAALARVLAPQPDILLLDEPTNHLDLPAIEWLEAELKGMRSALVTISHDRRFLENLSRAMVWLDRGVTRRLEQGFSGFEEWRDRVLEEEEVAAHKLTRKIAREEDWLRYGVTARRKRNVKRLGDLHALRRQHKERRGAVGSATMAASEGAGSGTLVAAADRVSKGYDGRTVVRDLSTRVLRGDRLGIVGPNGAGKTTLLNMLTGALSPDSGEVRLGTAIEMVSLDQRRRDLAPGVSLSAALTGGQGDMVYVGGTPRHVVGYMKDFLFTPEQARTPVELLSGGERGRLMLARALARPSNLLVLDEPTNDLDLETLDLLQELVAEYAGTVLLVSHDRDFLDRTATSVIAAEGDGAWQEYAGGYSDMVAQRGHGVRARGAAPAAVAGGGAVARNGAGGNGRAVAAPAPAARARLSMAEREALKALPGRIEKLGAEIGKLDGILADPGLYARDAGRFRKASEMAAQRRAELARAEEEWLELEVRREAAEA